ncbi:uncharacterized protein LOC126894741 isoform X3 [Daktulosphaira vitifoliae]|uniref:uncharacterized protein LOC126894741 isoform X3 n=1 Tax=Daktulosphaira vitifoliae TaxID=58002 RepID=UPI0021AA5A4E|nr:uncharacterized protein LOC126894741 isoform X3 [Daktulosphaira vitifoliae]
MRYFVMIKLHLIYIKSNIFTFNKVKNKKTIFEIFLTTSPLTTFYNNDYRPDDEPPPEAILEEKRILGHHLRRPSPTRWAPSLNSSMQPPTTLRPGTSQSMRVRTSGSSPRRSLQRSTAFRSKRSLTITDRGRTASMPAVPVTHGISRVCLFSIDLQFFDLCIRAAAMYKKLNKNLILVYRFKKTIQHNKGIENLSKTNMEFMNLNKISTKINQSYSSQLFLIVGLHFYSVLVNVYLFVFHTFALGIPWTVILNLRFLNTLWRLNIICGAAHYTVNQALHVYRKLGQLRTSCVGPKDIEEIEIIFFQYNVENLSFTLFGIMKLDFSLMLLPSFGHVPRPDGPVLEEYRLRSFSITASGVCNLGDFVRYAPPTATTSSQHLTISKRDSSPASVSSSPLHQNIAAAAHTVCTEFSRFRKPSTALISKFKANDTVESYKVALLGAPGVGKTTISVQFSTSEYICVYDTSIDEDCACRTIRVMINGQEAELTIIDIPYKEMSIETLCSTYNPNVFIVMYSIVDERSFDIAEQMLLFLWKGEYIHTKGVILVGNKSDLERTRRIQTNVGRSLAFSWNCKFIETSGGIDHNVDKLLVGILAQIKLNPLRERMYNSKRKKYSVTRLYKNFLAALRGVKSSENLFSI